MTQEEKQVEFNNRVQELLKVAKSMDLEIFAVQQITQGGYIETVPMFRNLKKYAETKTKKKK